MTRKLIAILLVVLPLAISGPAEAGWEEGVAAFKTGNFTAAAKEFQAVVQEKPEWPGGHFMLGQALQKLNRDAEALNHLRKAYDLNPNEVAYKIALAKAYVDNKRFSDGATLLENINASSLPKSQQGTYQQLLAAAYEGSGQSDRATAALKQIAAANPNDGDSWYRYGLALYNAGNLSEAISALEKAARLDAKDSKKKSALVTALVRSARTSAGNTKVATYKKAATVAQQLVTSSPTYENLLTLGEVQLGAKDYSSAAASFKSAAAKNSSDWLVHYYLGQAQTSLSQYADAEATLRAALGKANEANKRKIWSQIGFVNEKLKKYPAALEAYAKAGDTAGKNRVEENQRIASENQDIEAENRRLEQMEAERKALEEQLRDLPGGRPPGR